MILTPGYLPLFPLLLLQHRCPGDPQKVPQKILDQSYCEWDLVKVGPINLCKFPILINLNLMSCVYILTFSTNLNVCSKHKLIISIWLIIAKLSPRLS